MEVKRLTRFALCLVGVGAYLAADDVTQIRWHGRRFRSIGHEVLYGYSVWRKARLDEAEKAARHVKPNRKARRL